MPRIRTIKPEFFTSLTIADLTLRQRLTFIGLWTQVDDEGRCVDDARLIKAALWPLDDIIAADVEEDLTALHQAKLIIRYEFTEPSVSPHGALIPKRYLAVTGFREHQKINRPSKSRLPAPPELGKPAPPGIRIRETAGKNPNSVSPHGALTEPSLGERKGKERKGTKNLPTFASLQSAPLTVVAEIVEEPENALAIPKNGIDTTNTGQLLAAWIDHCTHQGITLPPRIKGQYAKTIKENLDAGIHPDLIKQALGSMLADGVAHQPHWLAARIVSVQTGPERRRRLTPGEESALRLNGNGHNANVADIIKNILAEETA